MNSFSALSVHGADMNATESFTLALLMGRCGQASNMVQSNKLCAQF